LPGQHTILRVVLKIILQFYLNIRFHIRLLFAAIITEGADWIGGPSVNGKFPRGKWRLR
jgi:hypothetical protein